MLDPKKMAELEQSIAGAREIFGPYWWSVYQGAQEAGFTKREAFVCLLVYIQATAATSGINTPTQEGWKDDDTD